MPARDVVFRAGRLALDEKNRYSRASRASGRLFVSRRFGDRDDGFPERTQIVAALPT
jgi:hypothetical protein